MASERHQPVRAGWYTEANVASIPHRPLSTTRTIGQVPPVFQPIPTDACRQGETGMRRDRERSLGLLALMAALAASGCLNAPAHIPMGRLPPPAGLADSSTATVLGPVPIPAADSGKTDKVFELPPGLPGANVPPVKVPQLPKSLPAKERE